jgi:hypothetical protein
MASSFLLTCAICNQPISLEESKVTEDGKAVHEECYYQKIKMRKEAESQSLSL